METCGHHREKPQYRCTITVPDVHNSPNDILENLPPIRLLVCTNLFVPSHFCTTNANCENCCQRYVVTCGKKLYKCTSTFSALNYCSSILIKSFCYLYEVGHKFFLLILEFSQFVTTILLKLWRYLVMEMDTL